MKFLKGDYEGDDEVTISLKSVVPFLLCHPNLIIPYGHTIADVIPFYKKGYDYLDVNVEIIDEQMESPAKLIKMFTQILQDILTNSYKGKSRLDSIPKIVLDVDIGSASLQLEKIQPTQEEVDSFQVVNPKMGSASSILNAKHLADGSISESQKHNILLIDMLLRRCRNANVGGE